MTAATLTRRPAPPPDAGRRPYAYNRLSSFRVEDLNVEVTRAVHRQRADADRAAEDRDLGPVVHITDEGQSASRFARKARDGWPVLLDAVRNRRVSYVLVWLLDRAVRQTRDIDDLLDACRETGTLILQTGTGTVIDPDNPDSVSMAKISAVLAEAEVAKMSKRVRRAHAEKATLGQFPGGKRRFGYNRDMSRIDETEAAIIRRIAADIIEGRTLHNIAKELNSNGTPPPMWKGVPYAMGEWTGSNLGTLMKRPHLAGTRVHKEGDQIAEYPGAWAPILDRETFDTVCAVLGQASRKTSTGTARAHLLSGLVTCGVCGAKVRAKPGSHGTGGAYQCPKSHVYRQRADVDAVIVAAVVGVLSRPDFADVFSPDTTTGESRATLQARMDAIEDELEEWVTRRRNGTATPRQEARATAEGMAEIARLRAALDSMAVAAAVPLVLDGIAGNPDAAAVWDGLDLDRRRAVVAALADIRLMPAARKGARLDMVSV
jgi:site-specific DNA recombinase